MDVPLLYVPGNHDESLEPRDMSWMPLRAELPIRCPQGCDSIDGRVVEVHGLRIAGLGGSLRYKEGPNQYSQGQIVLFQAEVGIRDLTVTGVQTCALPIYDLVRDLAGDPRLRELQQHPLRVDEPVAQLEVLRHPCRVHLEPLDDERREGEQIVQQDRRVRQDHALDRRMADVALVPQRDVLQGGQRVGPEEPGQPADPLRQLRVPLVRHRARALLPLAERLLRLEDLGALEPPHLERDRLERRGGHGEHRAELGVAIPLDDLRGDERGLEPELPTHLRLELGLAVGEGAHGRSEEHTSELQSQSNLVCRLLLEKKKKSNTQNNTLYERV